MPLGCAARGATVSHLPDASAVSLRTPLSSAAMTSFRRMIGGAPGLQFGSQFTAVRLSSLEYAPRSELRREPP
jgi:hypothetical protein